MSLPIRIRGYISILILLLPAALIVSLFSITNCSLFSMSSLCPLNSFGLLILMACSLGGTVYTVYLIGCRSLNDSTSKFLRVLILLHVVQLSFAQPINDSINLWQSNPNMTLIAVEGIFVFSFILFPYILWVLFLIASRRQVFVPDTRKEMTIPFILCIGAISWMLSNSLNSYRYYQFSFGFGFASYMITSMLFLVTLITPIYIRERKVYSILPSILYALAGGLWIHYISAIFNGILNMIPYTIFSGQHGQNTVTIIYMLVIFIHCLLYLSLIHQIYTPDKKAVWRLSIYGSILYVIGSFALSFTPW